MREIVSPLSGFASPFGSRRASGPRIVLSASSVLESALSGSTVGVLSVVNGSGSYTFTKTADPDSKFAVSGSNLNTAAALDFETASSHSVTITASKSGEDDIVRTFNIAVVNVFEQPDLGALSVPASVSRGSTVNITGATSGSTITGTMPTGWTLDGAARTIAIAADAPTGSQSWSLTETLADSSNSPRTSTGSSEVSAESPPEDLSTVYSFNFDDQTTSIPLRTYAGWTSTDDGNAARDLMRAANQQVERTGNDFTTPPRAIVHIDANLTGNVSFSFRGNIARTAGEVVLGGIDRGNYVVAFVASRTAQGASGGGGSSLIRKRIANATGNGVTTGITSPNSFNSNASAGFPEGGDNELMEWRVYPSEQIIEYYLNGRLSHITSTIDASTTAVWGGLYGFSTNQVISNIDDVTARTLSNRLTINNFPQEFYASEYTGNATSAEDFKGAVVALSGTYPTDGTIPTALQYRVVTTDAIYLAPSYATAPTYEVVQDWADCTDETFDDGNWTANARLPVGGPLYVEVRMRNDISVTAQTANDTTVGGLGLIYGQSNAAFAIGSDLTNVALPGDLGITAKDGAGLSNNRGNYERASNRMSAARVAAGIISDALGIPFAINGGGVGSQFAVALNPSNTNGAQFTDPIDGGLDSPWNLLKGKLGDNGKTDLGNACFMAWVQGEAEMDGTATFTPSTQYLPPVNEIISGLRSELAISSNAYFYMGITGRVLTETDTARDNKATLVRQTQLGFEDAPNNVRIWGSLAGVQMNDNFHYDPTTQWGLEEVGKRIALSVLFHQFGIGTHDGRGPRLLSASRSGAVITLPITAPGATAFAAYNGTAPATLASDSALTGYQVSADNFATLLTISSAALVGTDVVMTLSADPGGPVKVRSFHGKNPDITSWVYGTYTGFSRIAMEPLYVPLETAS